MNSQNTSYRICLEEARERYQRGDLKLCPEGYCTAKNTFEVYPSAYANGYAVQVCQGKKPDFEGNKQDYYSQHGDRTEKPEDSDLARWYQEEWVNICSYNPNTGTYAPCGRKQAELTPENYPYCRPVNKLPGTKVQTVNELTPEQINKMCELKQSLPQGVGGQPTRVYLF